MHTDESPVDEPIYWFTILDLAMEGGDLETAAEAVRELRRLGIDVSYRRECNRVRGGSRAR